MVVALAAIHDGAIDYCFDLVIEAIPIVLRYLLMHSDVTSHELGRFVEPIELILKVHACTLDFGFRSELSIVIERGLENGLRWRQL